MVHNSLNLSISSAQPQHPDERTSLLTTTDPSSTSSSSSSSSASDSSSSSSARTNPSELSLQDLNRSRRLLYVSHFFNQFSEQTWQFCLVLFLAAFSNYQSLILVTSYGLVSYSFVCVFGSTAGRFVDGTNRLQVARQFIGFENLAVLLATVMCYLLLSRDNDLKDLDRKDYDGNINTFSGRRSLLSKNDLAGIPTDPLSIFLLVGIHLLGAVASILDSGFLVAVERDWIVVMSEAVDHCTEQSSSSLSDSDEDLPTRTTNETVINNKNVVDNNNNNRNDSSSSSHSSQLEKQRQWLSDTNVFMRQIDLSCKIGAPAVAGIFVGLFDNNGNNNQDMNNGEGPTRIADHGYDLRGAAVLVGVLNVSALIVEYICTAKIYHDVPDLALKSEPNKTITTTTTTNEDNNDKMDDNDLEQSASMMGSQTTKLKMAADADSYRGRWDRFVAGIVPEDLRIYFDQSVCWAGFSLALLYLNVVLTFGGVMTAYLVWRGMGLESIGIWRGVASAAGLMGTFVYHFMSKRFELVEIGMMSVMFQFLCLSSSYVSLFVTDQRTSFGMLIAGVCLSRIGLWVFDISVTQLMQENIPAQVRGLVGGVQKSLNAFFTIVAFGVGLFVSDPEDFYIYASSAYAGVALAALFYGCQVFPKRSNLNT